MKNDKSYQPGDIVIVDLGMVKGHEQEGMRPSVIIKYFSYFKLIVILPLTTRDKGWATQVKILKDEGGLKEDSFALCHQIRSISIERIVKFLGRIKPLTLKKLKATLAISLNIRT